MQSPQRVRAEGLDYGLFEAAPAARDWMREQAPAPARVRVVGDDDSDGVASAHVVATALRRAGYDVETVVRPVHTEADVAHAIDGGADAYVVADAGSALLPAIDRRERPVLVLDHHRVLDHRPRFVHEVNPRRVGGDRTAHVSASVVSTLFAVAWDVRNWDLAYAGLAGAVSDRQHLAGFRGLLAHCVEGALQAGNVIAESGLTLVGPTVLDAVVTSVDPYLDGLTGDPAAVHSFLSRLGIEPGLDPLALAEEDARRLADALARRPGPAAGPPTPVYPLYGERLRLRHGSGVPSVLSLAKLLEAATAESSHRCALALLAGSRDAAQEADLLARHRLRRVVAELHRIRPTVHDEARLRWVETEDAANTGVYGHALLTFALGDAKPLVVLARTGDRVRASARGSHRLYGAGLDLSVAVAEAAEAVEGVGGGHPGAAGASIPAGRVREFLDRLDASLARLGRRRPP